ncbi:hypothetical protein [Nonomuraea aurantiaca]|uniref:hypothetical protein n=1 Tax=Nonomuraea aurantiaca TaxID=2878562 RepID=UPI001CD99C07|nr:hypothetical protein [Nonomuraea aurantiaca]MCA2229015.1 hypothetical protein [Nonomuraea aurantiaca]
MSNQPYTYTTLAMYGNDKPQLSVHFHTSDMRVGTLLVEGLRPVVHLSTCEADVMISTTGGGPVTDQDVSLARELLDAATRYLADCERLRADQSSSDTTSKAVSETAA